MTSHASRLGKLLDGDPTLIRKALKIMVEKNMASGFITNSKTAQAMADISAKSQRFPTMTRKQTEFVIGIMKQHASYFLADVESLARKERQEEIYGQQPEPEVPAEIRVSASRTNPMWGAF